MDREALKGMFEPHIVLQCQCWTQLKINTLRCNTGAGSNLAKTTAFTIQGIGLKTRLGNNTDGR